MFCQFKANTFGQLGTNFVRWRRREKFKFDSRRSTPISISGTLQIFTKGTFLARSLSSRALNRLCLWFALWIIKIHMPIQTNIKPIGYVTLTMHSDSSANNCAKFGCQRIGVCMANSEILRCGLHLRSRQSNSLSPPGVI